VSGTSPTTVPPAPEVAGWLRSGLMTFERVTWPRSPNSSLVEATTRSCWLDALAGLRATWSSVSQGRKYETLASSGSAAVVVPVAGMSAITKLAAFDAAQIGIRPQDVGAIVPLSSVQVVWSKSTA
jgi:hypothetical protein